MKANVKKLVLFVMVMIFSFGTIVAQTDNPDNAKMTKEERMAAKKAKKEEAKRQREENFERFKKYAEDSLWIVEAHTLYNKYNESYPIDPSINFVSMDGKEITVQLSFNNLIGWNGIGGVTLEGKITSYKVSDTNKNVVIKCSALGSAMGPVDLLASVNPDGYGRITISGNWGNRITFAGYYKPLEEARVYKGMPSY